MVKTVRVEDVYRLHGTASAMVQDDVLLEDLIIKFAREPNLCGVFLIDPQQRFAGMIARADLLKWSTVVLLGGKVSIASSGEAYRIMLATKARDLRREDWPFLGVKKTDTLQTALNQMIDSGEDIIPVLDSEGRILGDLRLSEVLLKAIEIGQQYR